MKKLVLVSVVLAALAVIGGCGQQAQITSPAAVPMPTIEMSANPYPFVATQGPYAGLVDPGQIYLQRLMEAEEEARQEKEKASHAQARAYSVDKMYWEWMEAARAGGWY